MTKTFLVAFAGLAGGAIGMVISFFIIAYVLASSPLGLFAGLFIIGICPIIGAFSAMRAGTLIGHFLDRFD